jgi:hypothetical protein
VAVDDDEDGEGVSSTVCQCARRCGGADGGTRGGGGRERVDGSLRPIVGERGGCERNEFDAWG